MKALLARHSTTIRITLLSLLWGSPFLWIKVALRGLSPVQIVLLRLALGALVLLAVLRALGLRLPRHRRMWAHLAVTALEVVS